MFIDGLSFDRIDKKCFLNMETAMLEKVKSLEQVEVSISKFDVSFTYL
tara:strand:- start:131 stop:274 length:144 start_codon:yes stop_codon:yes gene_type:complete